MARVHSVGPTIECSSQAARCHFETRTADDGGAQGVRPPNGRLTGLANLQRLAD